LKGTLFTLGSMLVRKSVRVIARSGDPFDVAQGRLCNLT